MPPQASRIRSGRNAPSFARGRKKGPDPRDIEVGRRVRALRLERHLSQTALADQLGLTFQQVQKYEKGVNRIGAGRLQIIAEIFKVSITDLFSQSPATPQRQQSVYELVDSAAALRLLRAYTRLSNSKLKQALVQMAVAMAGDE
jgi:transcriptional regulator with XRE-family HTH domain